jgi:outer membrane immunogenic protein
MGRLWIAFCVAVLVGLGADQAGAADLPVKMPIKARPAQPAVAWNGFYIGGDFGYAFANDDYVFDAATATALGLSNTNIIGGRGFSGGLLAGFNWLVAPRWLLGVEGDWSWQDIETNFSVGPTGGVSGSVTGKQNWAASVRARFGYLVTPGTLAYGTAGWAWSNYKLSSDGAFAGLLDASANINGFQAGIGMETALSGNWRGRIEYLQTFYNGASIEQLGTGVSEIKPSVGLGRVALIYQIGGAGDAGAPAFTRAPINARWSGLYAAGSIGGAMGYAEVSSPGVYDIKGAGLAGPLPSVMLGYNYQFAPRWLLGLEGELAPSVRSTDFKLGWLAAVRGRLGYLLAPDIMVYASGGWIGTRVDDLTYQGLVVVSGQGINGVQVGGGLEAALTEAWRLRLDYQYAIMRDVDVTSPAGGGVVVGTASPRGHVGRIAIVRQLTGL